MAGTAEIVTLAPNLGMPGRAIGYRALFKI